MALNALSLTLNEAFSLPIISLVYQFLADKEKGNARF
jgi:hypothetical protein